MNPWDQAKESIRKHEENFPAMEESLRVMGSASMTNYWRQRFEEERSLLDHRIRGREEEIKELIGKLQLRELTVKELALKLEFAQKDKDKTDEVWHEKMHTREVENQLLRERMEWESRFRSVWESEIKSRDRGDEEALARARKELEETQKNQLGLLQENTQLKAQAAQIQQFQSSTMAEYEKLKEERKQLQEKISGLERDLEKIKEEKEKLTRAYEQAPPQPKSEQSTAPPPGEDLRRALSERHEFHLAMMEDLARGFAHRVRNLLGIMSGNVQVSLTDTNISAEMKEQLTTVEQTGDELLQVVEDLLSLTKVPQLDLTPLNLNDFLQTTLLALNDSAQSQNVRINMAFQSHLPRVPAEKALLGQAISHIVANALEAMPQGGELKVTTRLSTDGTCVAADFQDSGKGVKDVHIKKLYQMYFSTKKGRKGLGLSLVQRVLDLHRGRVNVKSVMGQGTILTLEFPLST